LTSNQSLGLASLRIFVTSWDATTQALKDVDPVITNFPEPNKRHVQCGFASLIVIAANLFLSYVVNGNTSASLCRLMQVWDVKICDVETIL
jgi:hypothetical protein